ncbi:MAG: hypothetical protein KY469_01380 [Actinobacteria bacterium]|nr:hypothetical protein [Actinomycetota bacterium]
MASMKEVHIVLRWQPAYWATVIGAAMVLAGFAMLLLGWRGSAALLLVPLQLPYATSGGLAGLALVGCGAALLNVQVTRHLAAREHAHMGQVIRQATALMASAEPVGSVSGPHPPTQG